MLYFVATLKNITNLLLPTRSLPMFSLTPHSPSGVVQLMPTPPSPQAGLRKSEPVTHLCRTLPYLPWSLGQLWAFYISGSGFVVLPWPASLAWSSGPVLLLTHWPSVRHLDVPDSILLRGFALTHASAFLQNLNMPVQSGSLHVGWEY